MVPKSLQKLGGNSKKTPYVHKGPCFRGCIRIFGLLPASLTTLVVAVRGYQFLGGREGGLVLILGKKRILILGEGDGHMKGFEKRGEALGFV